MKTGMDGSIIMHYPVSVLQTGNKRDLLYDLEFLSCVFTPTAVMPVKCHDEGRKEIYNSVCPGSSSYEGYQMHAHPRRESTGIFILGSAILQSP